MNFNSKIVNKYNNHKVYFVNNNNSHQNNDINEIKFSTNINQDKVNN
jgi:hypothetical protein